MNMVRIIIKAFRLAIEQSTAQTKLCALLGKKKRSDYIKVDIPKKYLPMIYLLATYGIKDSEELLKILDK